MARRNLSITIDFSKYRGRYVALVDNHIISAGKDAKTVRARAKKKNPAAVPTLVKVPKGETLANCNDDWNLKVPGQSGLEHG